MAGYVGNIPVPQATQTRQSFTATASQTSFPTIGYTEGFFDCHLNGVKLLAGVDFNVGGGNGSDVILATGAALNDILEVTIFDTFNTSSGTFSSTTLKNNVTLKNDTHEDSDGGRASKIIYQGEQSGGEISTLAEIQASHDGSADDQKSNLIFRTNDGSDGTSPTEMLRIDSAGFLDSVSTSNDIARFSGPNSGSVTFRNDTSNEFQMHTGTSDALIFGTNGENERMRITNDGIVLVGNITSGFSEVGAEMRNGAANYAFLGTSSAFSPFGCNRTTSFGNLFVFRKDNSNVGVIASGFANELSISASGTNSSGILMSQSNQVRPMKDGSASDNTQDLGVGNGRWQDIFATNGTIQTSDENEKQNIASLTSAEITAATAISKLFKTYKWKDKVATKGDDARTHTGVIAQQVEQAMSDAKLDASKYAFWCSDTWWEIDEEYTDDDSTKKTRTNSYKTKEEAPEGATEHTRMGIRYPELLAFIGAATEQRLTSIESRLTALEAE